MSKICLFAEKKNIKDDDKISQDILDPEAHINL